MVFAGKGGKQNKIVLFRDSLFNFIPLISRARYPLREKQKYQVSNVRVKSKIVTFASHSIIEFKQFLTKPNLTCSVVKMIVDFFRF